MRRWMVMETSEGHCRFCRDFAGCAGACGKGDVRGEAQVDEAGHMEGVGSRRCGWGRWCGITLGAVDGVGKCSAAGVGGTNRCAAGGMGGTRGCGATLGSVGERGRALDGERGDQGHDDVECVGMACESFRCRCAV